MSDLCHKISTTLCLCPKWDTVTDGSWVAKNTVSQPAFMISLFLQRRKLTCRTCFFGWIHNTSHGLSQQNSSPGKFWLGSTSYWSPASLIMMRVISVSVSVKGSNSKNNPPAVQETRFSPWVGKIPWRMEWLSTPVFLPGEFHGQRSLVDYSPWGCKGSDTTEPLSLFFTFSAKDYCN